MSELPRGIIKHTQLFRHDPDNGVYGDCWRTTVACLLRLPVEAVPHVCDGPDDGKASERMRAFLASQNCAMIQVPFSGELSLDQVLEFVGSGSVSNGLHWCLMGTSRTGCNHVVICKGSEIVHDPSITQSGIIGPSSDGVWWAEWIVQRPACDALVPPPVDRLGGIREQAVALYEKGLEDGFRSGYIKMIEAALLDQRRAALAASEGLKDA